MKEINQNLLIQLHNDIKFNKNIYLLNVYFNNYYNSLYHLLTSVAKVSKLYMKCRAKNMNYNLHIVLNEIFLILNIIYKLI